MDLDEHVLNATLRDADAAALEFEQARSWLRTALTMPMEPLGAEVWAFDAAWTRVVLVHHPWRGWVPPGGKVEPGETPREAAQRELAEETGLRLSLLEQPAAVTVRSFGPDLPPGLSLSYVAIAPPGQPLVPEAGQPAAWTALSQDWTSCFPDDRTRMRQYLNLR